MAIRHAPFLLALVTLAPATAGAEEAMTLGFFKRAQAQGGETAARAERYVDGTLHGMLLLSDSLQQDDRPAFCADDAQERLGLLRLDRLGAGFRAWLGEGAASDSDQPEMQEAPLAMFALSYLTATLPCAEAATGRAGDDAALDSALQRALPR